MLDRVVLIGGSSDLGLAVVERLVVDGTRHVHLLGRDAAAMEAAAERLRELGADVVVGRLDLGASDAASAYTAAVGDAEVDGVVLAAAAMLPESGPLDDAAPLEMASVNLVGTFAVLRAAAAGLEAQGRGTLIVFSSVSGQRARWDNGLYSASKAALDNLSESLRHRLHPHGVRVITVRPGFVHTKMTTGLPPAPFAVTPERVAADVLAGLRSNRSVVWTPRIMRPVFAVLRRLPDPVWRRMAALRR